MTAASNFDSTLDSLGIQRSDKASQALANAQGKSTMGQADFLKLMTTQLQNQDPFQPVDNTQMISQMAQFSSLSGQQETNSTLKAIAAKLGATSSGDALGWVGKNVLTDGSSAYPTTTGSIEAAVQLDGAASDVNVTIADASGRPLRTVSLGPQDKGVVDFSWDGTTDTGEPAGPGPFTITANAVHGGDKVPSHTLVWGPVRSVNLSSDGDPVLNVPGIGQIPASAVRSVG